MYQIFNGFLGYPENRRNENFSTADAKEKFIKNLKIQGPDWYFRKNPNISYVRNSLGHRCKDVSEIDLDNYILTTGCSQTEGIGLPIEKTYSYLLAEKLQCDYYNLGLEGTGIDTMIHNLTIWMNTYKKPKLLVVRWPEITRYILYRSDSEDYTSIGPWITDDKCKYFILLGDEIKFFASVFILARIKIDSFNIPTIYVCPGLIPSYEAPTHHKVFSKEVDKARDMDHSGIITNMNVSIDLYKKYQEMTK